MTTFHSIYKSITQINLFFHHPEKIHRLREILLGKHYLMMSKKQNTKT